MTDIALIDEFTGEWRFLSNFYVHNGWTVEHHFQAAKTDDPEWVRRILNAPTPGAAKKFGRMVPIRSDWDEVKVEVMRALVRIKFSTDLQPHLLSTGEAELVEGNWWGDQFWGVCDGKGENWLGRILMETRAAFRG